MSLPDRLRLPLRFDAAALRRDLVVAASTGWTSHFVEQNYEGDWSAIALRAPAGESHPIRLIFSNPAAETFVDTDVLAHAPYFRRVLAAFGCPLLSVRLMRLAPGSRIKPHRDPDLDAESGVARLHVPILTGPAVDFRLNGTPVVMSPGECWYLRLSDEHSVHNRESDARVHLVLDARADAWLGNLLVAAAAAA